jgi:hypothetical protein
MNPTDKVDDLLAKAGARWRADQPSAPEPDLDRMLHHKRPRRWVPALAAASVAAIATAALIVLPGGSEPSVAPSTDKPAVAKSNGSDPDSLLVRNGDRVEMSGEVIAAPGKSPIYCAPHAEVAIGYPPGKEPAPTCSADISVRLIGVDLDRLTEASTIKGVRSGQARLVGIWQDRTVTVQEQTAPTVVKATPSPRKDAVPCPTPSGGWPLISSNIDRPEISQWLAARAGQIDNPALLYPEGASRTKPMVVRIGVAHGDLDTFRREFEKVYQGNLCVVRATFSQKDVENIQNALAPLHQQGLGITGSSGPGLEGGDKIHLTLLVFDEKTRSALTPIGLDKLALNPAVIPLR